MELADSRLIESALWLLEEIRAGEIGTPRSRFAPDLQDPLLARAETRRQKDSPKEYQRRHEPIGVRWQHSHVSIQGVTERLIPGSRVFIIPGGWECPAW